MPSSTSTSLLLLYGLDESANNATRANSGYLGTAQDLSVAQASGSDGIPAVPDGNGGRAAHFDVSYPAPSTLTATTRYLRGAAAASGAVHTCLPVLPIGSAANDWAMGCRFKWVGGETDGGGAAERQTLFALLGVGGATQGWRMSILPDTNANPAAGARIDLHLGDNNYELTGASYTITNSPATHYILPDVWYRLTVRVYFSATGYVFKGYLYNELTGVLYTWTLNTPSASDWAAGFLAATDVRVCVGGNNSYFYGYVDECWLYDAPMTDTEATSTVTGGFSVGWTPPSYRVADHVVYAAVTNEGESYPGTRAMATGATSSRFPPDRRVNRARLRVEGWRPGRPWLLRSAEGIFDTSGPFSSKLGNRFKLDDVNAALYRAGGELPAGSWEDARNVETSVRGPRRRRGFRVRRNVSQSQGDASANAFFFFRSYSDTLFGVYKVGSALYEETGSSATSLDTGWNSQQLPVFMSLDNRAIILSGARRKTWTGSNGAVQSLGVSAPSSLSYVDGVGGTLSGTYYYAYTEYDPLTGDESAPKVGASSVSPSGEKVTLTMDAVNSDTRFSQRRIYRTTNGGSAPNLFLIDTITSATSYDDTGEADGTTLVGQVTDSSGTFLAYLTGALPDTFAIGCVHSERCFYSAGESYPERIYVTESQEVQRFFTDFYLVCEGPVRALLSWGHRLMAFTDSTVEIFESDWVRDADGDVSVQHTVLSRTVGCVGPHAAKIIEGAPVWMDRRAVWTMKGTEPDPLSDPIRDLFPYINHGISRRAVLSFNHVRRQVWLSVAHATLQDDSSRFQTVLVLDLDALQAGSLKWTIYEQEASFHGTFDDDLNGLQFGLMDHLGCFKLGESYEGDGAQGNESYTTEDEGGDSGSVGISSISGSVVTAFGTPGWTTDALRGFGVVLRDRSTSLLYWYLIASNTSSTFTVVGTPPAALAARDGYYIGGIHAYVQYAEQAFATPNEKVVRQVHLEFADLTQTGLYL